ncbi:actin-binding WH2 domain-containing protein [bacterium]|nr:MAG: actin-binding WH2 domain-containing protein [bacterium]
MGNAKFKNLLRDRESFFETIFRGEKLYLIIIKLLIISILLFAVYGFVMGIYNSVQQAISSMIKVPVLFYLCLFICYPALFVFNILIGSKLTVGKSLAMILSAYTLIACVLASFAPIAMFFILIGSSYPFLRLLHVAIFTISGIAGMMVLYNGLTLACEYQSIYPKQSLRVFQVWVIIFAFVGSQLAWNLRPFIGNKNLPFQLFRKQESNFYSHIFHTINQFIFGEEQPEKPKPDTTYY